MGTCQKFHYCLCNAGVSPANAIILFKLDTSDQFQSLKPFFRGLGHEIRNPVQGILASAEALRCLIQEDAPVTKLLEMIQRECIRIDALLSDLVALSEPICLDAEPQTLVSLLSECARMHSTTITTEISDDLPPLRFDRTALRRAVLAVLQNAAESEFQDQKILLSAENIGQSIQITVKDYGRGILPEDLQRVAEPFFSTRPRKAGLGLTIAERIVRLHNGDFHIQSEPGKGTVVTILLSVER